LQGPSSITVQNDGWLVICIPMLKYKIKVTFEWWIRVRGYSV
jgi:hypothetical protein